MIGYVIVGSNDIERSVKFYDGLLGILGAHRFIDRDNFVAWHSPAAKTALCVTRPFDQAPATVGNGSMIALKMDSQEEVDALHRRALELGATDEGAPGPRGDNGFYAGYFRDPSGNKLNAFFMA